MQQLTVLGSTGSIGRQTLEVLSRFGWEYQIFALTAYHNVDRLYAQCVQFAPRYAVMVDAVAAQELRQRLLASGLSTEVLSGAHALREVASAPEVDRVMAAITGAAGLPAVWSAAEAGKCILLANKEALVMGGELFMRQLRQQGGVLLPIDSEHQAVKSCLPSAYQCGDGLPKTISQVILTASGGPFRQCPLERLASVRPDEAVAHPTWSMGAKISVDSATLVNKALELLEAKVLFQLAPSQLKAVIHPSSNVHAMLRYRDGSLIMHCAQADMALPIAAGLCWPEALPDVLPAFDPVAVGQLEFFAIDSQRYPCFSLGLQVLQADLSASIVFNAANEVAVQAFLHKQLPFLEISAQIEHALSCRPTPVIGGLEDILALDGLIRRQVAVRIASAVGV